MTSSIRRGQRRSGSPARFDKVQRRLEQGEILLVVSRIDAVDLAVKLKQLTGKRLQPEVFKTIRTIGDVVDALSDIPLE